MLNLTDVPLDESVSVKRVQVSVGPANGAVSSPFVTRWRLRSSPDEMTVVQLCARSERLRRTRVAEGWGRRLRARRTLRERWSEGTRRLTIHWASTVGRNLERIAAPGRRDSSSLLTRDLVHRRERSWSALRSRRRARASERRRRGGSNSGRSFLQTHEHVNIAWYDSRKSRRKLTKGPRPGKGPLTSSRRSMGRRSSCGTNGRC